MIQKISVDITTTYAEGASTRGAVFLGVAGREFRLDIGDHADFEEGDDLTYVFGDGSNVLFPERNDPRVGVALSLEDAAKHPCYIRLDAQKAVDDWELASVRVRVVATEGSLEFQGLQGSQERLWLGPQSGMILHLRRV